MKGGEIKTRNPVACKNADHLCSYTRRTGQDSAFSLPSTMMICSSSSACIKLSECKGACGRRPFAGGIPSISHSAEVKPSSTMPHAKPPGFVVPYASIVQMIEMTS